MEVRWNSTFTLVEGLVPMQTAISRLFREDSDFKDITFSSLTWEHLHDLLTVLEHYSKATVHLQGLKFSTLGTVAQAVSFLIHTSATHEDDTAISEWGRSLATHTGFQLQSYLDLLVERESTQFSAILNPSIKMALAEQMGNVSELRMRLKDTLVDHYTPDES
ncbi:unnamed protein product [Tilletia controversa]|nr:unnamed protein product [Tilletia controversa]CAD6927391.1 unnamed protein product [Tilletia controversa]